MDNTPQHYMISEHRIADSLFCLRKLSLLRWCLNIAVVEICNALQSDSYWPVFRRQLRPPTSIFYTPNGELRL